MLMRALMTMILLASVTALAQIRAVDPGPVFGPEFTVADPNKLSLSEKELIRFVEPATQHLFVNQPEDAKFKVDGQFFVSPNGWDFFVSSDPGVLEFTMKPMTVQQFEKYAVDIQDAIFVTAANAGLFPSVFMGGGHINIDLEYLVSRPLLFRNFLADLLVNHVELFMGVLGYDTNSSLPMIMKSKATRNKMKAIFDAFDRIKHPTRTDAEKLALRLLWMMQARGVVDNYAFDWTNNFERYEEDHAVYFNSNRLELRAVRPQASMDVWVRQIRLLRNRLRFLQKQNRPMPLELKFNLGGAYADTEYQESAYLNPPIPAREALKNFKIFVEQSGEKIEDHLDYVWPAWHSDGSVAEFASKNSMACSHLLKGQIEKP